MKTIPTTVQPYLDQKTGTDPIITVDINWNGSYVKYSSIELDGYQARLLSISSIDSTTTISGSTSNQQVSIVLRDDDGVIKDILDSVDVFNRPVKIYLSYDSSERMLLFDGNITTPLEWGEGDRSVSFTILTDLVGAEAGYSVEDTEDTYNNDIEGVAWPFIFGNVGWSKALKIKSTQVAVLDTSTVSADEENLNSKICQARYIQCGDITKTILTESDFHSLRDIRGGCQLKKELTGKAMTDSALSWFIGQGSWSALRSWINNPSTFNAQLAVGVITVGSGQIFKMAPTISDSGVARTQAYIDSMNEQQNNTTSYYAGDPDYMCWPANIVNSAPNGSIQNGKWVYTDDEGVQWTLVVSQDKNSILASTPNLECIKEYQQRICELEYTLANLRELGQDVLYLKDVNDNFPRNEETIIEVHGLLVNGILNDDDEFTVINIIDPLSAAGEEEYNAICSDPGSTTKVIEENNSVGDWELDYTGWYKSSNLSATCAQFTPDEDEDVTSAGIYYEDSANAAWDLYTSIEVEDPGSASAGEPVYIYYEDDVKYLVSLTPGVVESVAAYKQNANGTWRLTDLSTAAETDIYTVHDVTYGGYSGVEIRVPRAFSSDSSWGDDLYVCFSSDTGPNGVDVIRWFIETYTDITIDDTSFNYVKDRVNQIPVNFTFQEKTDVLSLVSTIAEQMKCAIYFSGNLLKIVHLPLEPTSVVSLGTSEILKGSIKVGLSDSNNLYTKIVGNWVETDGPRVQDDELDFQVIRKNNNDKYGLRTQEIDYFAFNQKDVVEDSVDFWINRRSKIWKIVTFQLPFSFIYLEPFDCVFLEFMSAKGIITSIVPNFESKVIDIECWTNVPSGSTVPDDSVWSGYVAGLHDSPVFYADDQFNGVTETTVDSNEELELRITRLEAGVTIFTSGTTSITGSPSNDADEEPPGGVDAGICKWTVRVPYYICAGVCGYDCGIGIADQGKCIGPNGRCCERGETGTLVAEFYNCQEAVAAANAMFAQLTKTGGCIWSCGDRHADGAITVEPNEFCTIPCAEWGTYNPNNPCERDCD